MDFLFRAISFVQASTMDVNFSYNHFMISISVYATIGSSISNTVFDVLSSDDEND